MAVIGITASTAVTASRRRSCMGISCQGDGNAVATRDRIPVCAQRTAGGYAHTLRRILPTSVAEDRSCPATNCVPAALPPLGETVDPCGGWARRIRAEQVDG